MNELKKTGIQKIIIGDPWGPNSGNFIHVLAIQQVTRKEDKTLIYTQIEHRIKVESFNDILPKVLELCAKYKAAGAP